MKRITLQTSALLAVLAFSAALAASASAGLPELLGWETKPAFTGKNDGTESLAFETVKKETFACAAMTLDGTQETDTLGVYHMHITGCKSSGFACNTTGDASGVILTLGKYNFVDDHLSENVNELGVAMLFLPEALEIKCTSLITIKLTGHLVCLVLEPLVSKVEHLLHCIQTSGKQADKEWWNDEGKKETSSLLTSKNGGAFEESGALLLFGLLFSTVPVAFMNE